MKEKTYKKYLNTLIEIANSGLSIPDYFQKVADTSVQNFYAKMRKVREDENPEDPKLRQIVINKYESLKGNKKDMTYTSTADYCVEEVDNAQQSSISYIRDEDGNIKYYQYDIYKKGIKPSLHGRLTKEEMNTIYRLYTYYGDNLTARVVSRHFPDLSLPDFKRIVRAFNIYKDSSPFAPHMYEEYSEDELRDMQCREKENSFLRKAEEDRIRDNEKLLRKYAQENIDLRNQIDTLTNINLDVTNIEPYHVVNDIECGLSTALNIYLSDIHLGASVEQGSLYNENESYGFYEAKRRLSEVLDKLYELGQVGTVNVCLLGDNIDCCGFTGMTGSMSHQMPENMDPREQFNKFVELYDWFIRSLNESGIVDGKINVYSVPTGNHAANYEYALNNTLKFYTEARFPEVKFTLFDQFFGVFYQNDVPFVITHGKDGRFMKKGLPLNVTDKDKVRIYEWLDDNKLYGDNIHIIKGDLHSNNLNSCKRFTYRNVLSLFGASDYSNYGFSRNSYGVSYDLIINQQVLGGTIENI